MADVREDRLNHVGQVVQMDGTGITTCLIVGRRQAGDWTDLWDWEIVVLDHAPHLKHSNLSPVHASGDTLILNNQYVEKYTWSVT